MVADMVAFVASQFTTSTWDVGAQELCSVVLIKLLFIKALTMNECEEQSALGYNILAPRGGKRAQKNPNNPKSWGAEQKDPILPQ